MAMELFKLLGKIVVDNSGANKALDETGDKGEKAESKLKKAFGAVGKGAVAVGKTVATGLAAGATAFAGLTAKALSASGELEQNMGGSEAVFKQYATKMQETAKNAFSNMGLSTSDFLATANKMGALFQGAGFSIKESSDLSAKAMQRAADVASIMGIDVNAAMESIAGAAKGNFTMMDNLGVAINDTTIQTYAYSKGIDKATKDMTTQEKVGLAMELFMEKSAYAAGNYAKENETLAGSLGTAKAALTNFLDGSGGVEELVTSFKNLATVAVNSLKEIVPRLTSALPEIMNGIMPEIPGLVKSTLPGVIEGAVALLSGLAQILPDLAIVLIQTIPVIVGEIRNALETAFPELKQPFEVIEGLFNGIWQSMQIVWESLGKPIFDSISNAFSACREAVQPLIEAFGDYVTSGQFATDVTNATKSACDFLIGAYESVVGFVKDVVQGFKDVVEWGKEHETAMTMIGIAIGTVTAAIVAYNAAMAIKKAGGIVEIAQLGLLQVQLWGLQIAETAHTVATTIATAATTAFGAAMAFLTSPITLVVAAIGALIAIVVLCVKNWDKIKQAGSAAWDWIKNAWSEAGEWFAGIWEDISGAFSAVGEWFSDKFKKAKDGATNAWSDAKEKFSKTWSNIKDAFSSVGNWFKNKFNDAKTNATNAWSNAKEKFTGIKDKVTGAFSNVGSWFKNKFTDAKNNSVNSWSNIKEKFASIKDNIVSAFSNVKERISKPFENARDAIKSVVDKIKGFFSGLNIKFPNIKLPHFGISPSGWKIGDLLKGSIPKLKIDWYAEAMKNPVIMTKPTIFGYDASTGNLMGGGEAGSEVVSGTGTLMNMIQTAVSAQNEAVVTVLYAILDAIINGNTEMVRALLSDKTFKVGEREFARLVREYA